MAGMFGRIQCRVSTSRAAPLRLITYFRNSHCLQIAHHQARPSRPHYAKRVIDLLLANTNLQFKFMLYHSVFKFDKTVIIQVLYRLFYVCIEYEYFKAVLFSGYYFVHYLNCFSNYNMNTCKVYLSLLS